MSRRKFIVWIDDDSAYDQEIEGILSNHYDSVEAEEVER